MKNLFKGGKEWVLMHRFVMLVLMGLCGLALVFALHLASEFLLMCFAVGELIDVVEKFLASLYVIFLGLPTAIMLWFFRTHDTSEQIQKTKESTEISILFGAQEMLFAPSAANRATAKNVVGFALLIDLRRRGLHQSTIDLATSNANLSGIDLAFRDFHEVDLSAAKLQSANLSESDLTEASLHNADLTDANLQNANLQGADLANADLTNANLQNADLQGANLANANLTDANLQNADLQGANLANANLTDANLQNADLQGADLANANLTGTKLIDSDLRGADLRRATCYVGNIQRKPKDERALFTGALYSADPKLPKGVDPEKCGMKKIG